MNLKFKKNGKNHLEIYINNQYEGLIFHKEIEVTKNGEKKGNTYKEQLITKFSELQDVLFDITLHDYD